MEMSFIYDEKKTFMVIKKYTRNDNSLTIYSEKGKYIEKGEFDVKTGLYRKYFTKGDLNKKAKILTDPEYTGPWLPEVIVTAPYNNTSGLWLVPTISIYGNWNPQNNTMSPLFPFYYIPAGGGAPTSTANVNIIKDDFTNPCYKGVLNTLKNSGTLNNTIIQILRNFNNSNVVQLAFKNINDGDCMKDGKYENKTVFLNDAAVAGASKEYIAATIMHEIVHAYLHGLLLSQATEHNQIAQFYIGPMITGLIAMYPNLSWAEAQALSWGGLELTNVYKSTMLFTQAQKEEMNRINADFKHTSCGSSYPPTNKGTNCN